MTEPQQIKPGQFVCADCGGVFNRSDEAEALAELEANHPGVDPSDCGLLCDDCYQDYRQAISED